jgi:hypothetical protein
MLVGEELKNNFKFMAPYLPQSNFSFIPKPNMGAQNPVHNGVACFGEDLSNEHRLPTRIEMAH